MIWTHRPGFVLAISLVAAGIRACLYAFVLIPPWQAPDEPGHYAYARELAEYGLRRVSAAERAVVQSQIATSLQEERFWSYLRPPAAGARLRIYFALVQNGQGVGTRLAPDTGSYPVLDASYLNSQREDEPPLYYGVPALLFRLSRWIWQSSESDPLVSQLYLARGWSVVLLLVTILFVHLGLRELASDDRFVVAVGTALAALAPMPAFIGSACNNDVAAMASAAAVVWLLLRGLRRDWNARRLALLLALLVVASLTKKTTAFLWPLAAGAVCFRIRNPFPWGTWVSGTLVLAAAVGVAGAWPLPAASAWRNPATYQLAQRSAAVVHGGGYALLLDAPAGPAPVQVQQELPYNQVAALRGAELVLDFWVRGEGASGYGYVSLYDGNSVRRMGFRASPEEWEHVAVRYRVAGNARLLGVVLNNAGAGHLAFDDLSWQDSAGHELLANGGAERAARWSETWFARRRALSPSLWPHLFEVRSYDRASLARYALYVGLTLAGVWANFGWLTVPLAPAWYVLLALACGAAVIGLARAAVRRRGRPPAFWPGWLLAGLVLALIGAQTLLPMVGSAWQPQGRYLFPALLPAVALLARGWRDLAPPAGRSLWAGYLIVGFFAFEQVCIWGYLVPRYAGWIHG